MIKESHRQLSGDLSAWSAAGVLLLNRVLTTRQGESNAHANIGWQRITDHIAAELGKRDVVAVLWGKQAQELSRFFTYKVEGVHPSPLSAYRGFFGSKPFTQVNQLLVAQGREPIDWKFEKKKTPTSITRWGSFYLLSI